VETQQEWGAHNPIFGIVSHNLKKRGPLASSTEAVCDLTVVPLSQHSVLLLKQKGATGNMLKKKKEGKAELVGSDEK